MDQQPILVRPGEPGRLIVYLPYSAERVAKIKTIPGRSWNAEKKNWTVPAALAPRRVALFPGEPMDVAPGLLPPDTTRPLISAEEGLLTRVREAVRARNLSPRTADAYVHWVRCFVVQAKGSVEELCEAEMSGFLSRLALEHDVSGSTQNQVLNALLFLYQQVLGKDVALVEGVVRAKKPQRLPVVTSRRSSGGMGRT